VEAARRGAREVEREVGAEVEDEDEDGGKGDVRQFGRMQVVS